MQQIEEEAPQSILDQDLYKLCMQQAILEHYPEVVVEYGFVNRDLSMRFNTQAFDWIQKSIAALANISASSKDLDYLRTACPYLSSSYLEFLAQFRYDPANEISCRLDEDTGALDLRVYGKWSQVILYEVTVLALISESYYRFVDTDWDFSGQIDEIKAKGAALVIAGCRFAEFGTRRRRSYKAQDIVMAGLVQATSEAPGYFNGTSNVYLARKYGVAPVGTVGHEWTMGIAALEGTYENGNSLALRKWHSTFKGHLGIALTDTFGTKAFFANFDSELASEYNGVRHDSGDPFKFIETVCDHYRSLGIGLATKTIVFSDGLSPGRAILIKKHCDKYGIKCSFGIGTNFTNDFCRASNPKLKSEAVNIVIKLFKCNGRLCIKLSDVTTKHTGDIAEVNRARSELTQLGLLAE
ncbi:nicotinate phosphoribosyltransferase [Coemansia spiralis]|uniref:Nicotinate phosphoribosyltransferase n=2 Tax=Coemansia TaxID=4863 RepID=A0A9W8GEB8_9FUNG|nr:nicotinate phosphoribosyltransferase [Coemansia spiralis]KAJ1996319.1 nicotinate phosphoribosyltransferase [Coemansia umbellata]KAJ2625922.1 nicotinate phosphoribosyltransferase [Coemansia sp. RSA 1358]KAJ2680748.1 nicotinate phosphoribosyltransferase [Coemansia spiralis]